MMQEVKVRLLENLTTTMNDHILTSKFWFLVSFHAKLWNTFNELWENGDRSFSIKKKFCRSEKSCGTPPLKSTSPFPSWSKISITLCTKGFCCNSGNDINSSTDNEPEWSKSSFLNLFPRRFISSGSTEIEYQAI